MWSSAAVVALALAACASAPAVKRFAPMDQRAVTDVILAQADAWNRGDLAGYMDGYARIDELVFTSGGKVRRGWQATFDTYQAKYAATPGSMGHLEFGVTQVDALGADGAVVLGTWKLSGSEHPGSGVFTLVFARRPEGWRIVHDHTSLATP
jgi:beta-aspartyl-peptidase (threonine type)